MKICPYCEISGRPYFAIYSRTYYRCVRCDLIYQALTKSYDDVVASYHENYSQRYLTDQTEESRNIVFNHVLDLIESRKKNGTLLDVGTSCGSFLIAAQKRGWKVKGLEPSLQAADFVRQENHLDIFYGTLKEYKTVDQFDVITFINVLDHSALPWVEINRASNLLRSSGLLYLRFPNGLMHSQIYLLASKCGLMQHVSRFLVFHQYVFTPKYINTLLSDNNFSKIIIDNSLPSGNDPHGLFANKVPANSAKRLIYWFAQSAKILSGEKLFCGSSIEVIATERA